MNVLPPPPLAPASPRASKDPNLKEAADALEAGFLAEMLKFTSLGEGRSAFGGGPGESQFSSFLVRAQAEQIVQAGGIGLSDALYQALKERSNDH